MSSSTEKTSPSRPRKRRVKKREAGQRSCLEIAAMPHFVRGRGKNAARVSAQEILIRQQFDRALEGSVRDLEAIIKMHDRNRNALLWHQANRVPHKIDVDCVMAMEAALILDILRIDCTAYNVKRLQIAGRSVPYEFHKCLRMAGWVEYAYPARRQRFDEIRKPVHRSMEQAYYQQYDKLIMPEGSETLDDSKARTYALHHLRQRRALGGQFPEGESGNPLGRGGKKPEFELPFPWLEEFLVVEIAGGPVQMTRCEALIYLVQRKAFQNAILGRKLTALFAKAQLASWTPKSRAERKAEEESAEQIMRVPETVYDIMRDLQVISGRAKKSVLLKPWLVEAALLRLERKLDPYEQKVVVAATSRPYGTFWPEWWIDRPEPGRKPREAMHHGDHGRIVRC